MPARKPGRPPTGKPRRTRHTVTLQPEIAVRLAELGDGNLSAGIERAAKQAQRSV